MGDIISAVGFSLLTSLINDMSIIVIYISLVVLFFLLGLVLGLNIGTRKRIPKNDKTPDTTDSLNKSRQTYVPGQDSREVIDQQVYNTNPEQKHSRHRHHRHSSLHIQ